MFVFVYTKLPDMPYMERKRRMVSEKSVKAFAQQNNLVIGVTQARIFNELQPLLDVDVPFVNHTAEKRVNPFLTLPNAKSIICVGYPYPKTITVDKGISVAACGIDYHTLIMEEMEKLKAFLDIDGLCFSDTGPLVDRYIAYLCGIGFYGKNGFIINEKFGSLFFIGYILTDEDFDTYNTPLEKSCYGCDACIKACPTGAIRISENRMEYNTCISCITQIKGKLLPEQMEKISDCGSVYGCDCCQLSCPYNKDKIGIVCGEKDYLHFLSLTNKQFKQKYGTTAIAWRGNNTIKRNAIIAIAGSGDEAAIKDLLPFTKSENETLAYTANWAVKRLQGETL